MSKHSMVQCQQCNKYMVPRIITQRGIVFDHLQKVSHSVCPFCLSSNWNDDEGWSSFSDFMEDSRVKKTLFILGFLVAYELGRRFIS